MRLSFVGELGWELHIPAPSCLPVYRAVMAAGAKHGLVDAGYRAIDSLSIEKGERRPSRARGRSCPAGGRGAPVAPPPGSLSSGPSLPMTLASPQLAGDHAGPLAPASDGDRRQARLGWGLVPVPRAPGPLGSCPLTSRPGCGRWVAGGGYGRHPELGVPPHRLPALAR